MEAGRYLQEIAKNLTSLWCFLDTIYAKKDEATALVLGKYG